MTFAAGGAGHSWSAYACHVYRPSILAIGLPVLQSAAEASACQLPAANHDGHCAQASKPRPPLDMLMTNSYDVKYRSRFLPVMELLMYCTHSFREVYINHINCHDVTIKLTKAILYT